MDVARSGGKARQVEQIGEKFLRRIFQNAAPPAFVGRRGHISENQIFCDEGEREDASQALQKPLSLKLDEQIVPERPEKAKGENPERQAAFWQKRVENLRRGEKKRDQNGGVGDVLSGRNRFRKPAFEF